MIGKSVYVTETMLCTTLYYWALDNVQFLGSDSLPVNFFAVKGLWNGLPITGSRGVHVFPRNFEF